ncbi:MAG: MFS transporter [Hyphomicrobiaceae bacterium]|nr:MFS transporter [Hyphomicrobiaceae bacterium]
MSNTPSRVQAPLPWQWIVLAAAAVAGVGMGVRQTMGLFLKPMTMELSIGREDFALSIAIANIVWGMAAPFTGAIADKYGAGRVVLFGALNTALGLVVMWHAASRTELLLAGVLLGFGVAGAGINALVGAVGRAAPPEKRTQAIAAIGMGSGIGILIALPYTHLLMDLVGWKTALLVLAVTVLVLLPLAWPVSGAPRGATAGSGKPQQLREALSEAAGHRSFWLLNLGFFVCGFHVVFYGVHLPAYVADQGLPPSVAVTALVMVGIGNLIGTWLAGQSGRYMEKRRALSMIYALRSLIFLGFLVLPPTPTMIITASFLLGLVWLSTVPLTSGLVATFYGPAWMTMLYGIVFFSHQMGSFLGVWLGGRVFDLTKSYDTMWWICVALGLFAAAIHWPIQEKAVVRAGLPTAAE